MAYVSYCFVVCFYLAQLYLYQMQSGQGWIQHGLVGGGGCFASSGREFNYLSCDHHYDHQITENIYIRYSYYKIGTLQVDLLDH